MAGIKLFTLNGNVPLAQKKSHKNSGCRWRLRQSSILPMAKSRSTWMILSAGRMFT